MVQSSETAGHLEGAVWITCKTCGRRTVERGEGLERGQCKGCREAPRDNRWTKVYANQKDAAPPQLIRCQKCGRSYCGPRSIPGGTVLKCHRCLKEGQPAKGPTERPDFRPDPKLRTAARECCNLRGDSCLTSEARCAVLAAGRCGWFEKAVIGGLAPALRAAVLVHYAPAEPFAVHGGRVRLCRDCGEPVGKRQRFCDSCGAKRVRASNRKAKERERARLMSEK